MITPLDVACMQIIQAERTPETVHYHIDDPARSHPRSPLEEAPFHIVRRAIQMEGAAFDYYNNTLYFRV